MGFHVEGRNIFHWTQDPNAVISIECKGRFVCWLMKNGVWKYVCIKPGPFTFILLFYYFFSLMLQVYNLTSVRYSQIQISQSCQRLYFQSWDRVSVKLNPQKLHLNFLYSENILNEASLWSSFTSRWHCSLVFSYAVNFYFEITRIRNKNNSFWQNLDDRFNINGGNNVLKYLFESYSLRLDV